jgi:transposase-like protein
VRRGREFWADLVDECERGGGVAEVATRHGVLARTLSWWKWRLRGEAKRRRRRGRPAHELQLVPVEVEPVAGHVERHAHEIEIALEGVTVRVEVGADPAYVAALVRELRAC